MLPLMYLTPWFMALFTSLPCWDAVLAIWDMILLEGISLYMYVISLIPQLPLIPQLRLYSIQCKVLSDFHHEDHEVLWANLRTIRLKVK